MAGLVVGVEYKWMDGVKNAVKGSKKKGGLTAALNVIYKIISNRKSDNLTGIARSRDHVFLHYPDFGGFPNIW